MVTLAVCFSLLAKIPVMAQDEPVQRVLTVAFPEQEGINEIYDDGTYGGTTYDCLMEVSKYTGWEYEFITGDANELLDDMINGKYDLMGGMFYQEAFESYFNYPKYIVGKNYSALLCSSENQIAKRFDISTLNNMKIGVLRKANSKIERLTKFLDFNNVICELVYYDDYETYHDCVIKGETDLILGNVTDSRDGYMVVAEFESSPYYIVSSKDEPGLAETLSEVLTEIYMANPNFADELYDKYFSNKYIGKIEFSEPDYQYIETAEPIRVAVMRERYPIHSIQDGEHVGIVPDLLNLIEKRAGLSFKLVCTDTYQEAIDMVQQGRADLLGCYMSDSYAAQNKGLILTKAYGSLDAIIIKNKSVDYPSDALTMAEPYGFDLKNEMKDGTIVYYDTYEACLNAVNSGKIDFLRIPSAFLDSIYHKRSYPNVTITSSNHMTMELSIAILKSSDVKLYSLLNKAINSLSEEDKSNLIAGNLLSSGSRNISIRSFVYSNPIAVVTVCAIFFSLVLSIVILIAKNKVKNNLLIYKMEKIKETAQAKYEFLSRMSHEIRTPMNAIVGLTTLTKISCELPEDVKTNLDKIDTSAQFMLSLINDILDMSKIDSGKMKIENAPMDLNSILNEVESMFAGQAKQKELSLSIKKEYDAKPLLGDEIRLKQVLVNLLSNACKFTDCGGNIVLLVKQLNDKEEEQELLFSVKDNGIGIGEGDASRIFEIFEQVPGNQKNERGTGLGLSISSNLIRLMGGNVEVKSKVGEGAEFFFTLKFSVNMEEPIQEQQTKELPQQALDNLHILLAEDNELNAEIAISLLELKGVKVERAADGQEAVDMFLSKPAQWFDAILMDIQMPRKDGISACVEIRGSNHPEARSIPIIAMTANALQKDRDNAANAGMTGFIPKPFNVEHLYQTLDRRKQL